MFRDLLLDWCLRCHIKKSSFKASSRQNLPKPDVCEDWRIINVRVCTYALFVLTMSVFRISVHAILTCAAVSLQKEAFESYMLRNKQVWNSHPWTARIIRPLQEILAMATYWPIQQANHKTLPSEAATSKAHTTTSAITTTSEKIARIYFIHRSLWQED
jgi:hypothetical protein